MKGKAPIPHRNEGVASARIPKGGRPVKQNQVKQEAKVTESSKKATFDSSLNVLTQELDTLGSPTNLMLDSRTVEAEKNEAH